MYRSMVAAVLTATLLAPAVVHAGNADPMGSGVDTLTGAGLALLAPRQEPETTASAAEAPTVTPAPEAGERKLPAAE